MASHHEPQRLAPPWIPPAAGRANRSRRVIIVDRRRSLWTPANITTAVWLDASDASTVTTVGTKVSEWRDKSGNSRHVLQSDDALRPTYSTAAQNGLSIVEKTSVSGSLISSAGGVFSGVSGGYIIIAGVSTHRAVSGTFVQVVNSSAQSRFVVQTTTAGVGLVGGRRLAADTFVSITGATNVGTGGNIIVGTADYANRTARIFLNETQDASSTVWGTAGSTENNTGTYNILGNIIGSAWEIVIGHGVPSTDTRQRLAGYLAHKWGITSVLPAGHPFKTWPPYV